MKGLPPCEIAWWRHQMETFSALLAICAGNSPVSGEFPTQRQVTRSFDVSFDLRLNKRLRKWWWGWWFETLSRPLWRQCNGVSPIWQQTWKSNTHNKLTNSTKNNVTLTHIMDHRCRYFRHCFALCFTIHHQHLRNIHVLFYQMSTANRQGYPPEWVQLILANTQLTGPVRLA